MKKALRALCLVTLTFSHVHASEGKFINPVTDVCWECILPITLEGRQLTPGEDLTNYKTTLACACAGTPPKIGAPITFWEPTHLVDVTRHAYKLMGLGGITVGKESVKNRGSVGVSSDEISRHSFYHVHWYTFPILSWLELLTDFECLEKGTLDVGYISELDPTWNDDNWAAVLNPEAILFSSPLAHMSCVADCAKSTFSKPLDKLFWCAGCEGSLYPFTGTVSHHVGGIQASSLLVHRLLARLHRAHILLGYPDNEYCQPQTMPFIKKSLYKTQLVYPVAATKGPCNALGKSDIIWGSGKSFPYKGEDFVYLIWNKKQCCMDAVQYLIPELTSGGRL